MTVHAPGLKTRRQYARGLPVWLTLLVFALQSGCSGLPVQVPDTGWQDRLGQVAIVSAAALPEIAFEGFAHGRGEGAVQGAGSAFSSCLGGMAQSGCSGEFCGAAMIIMLGVCGVAGLVGGAVGAGRAMDADAVQQSGQVLSGVLQPAAIQAELRQRLVARAAAQGRTLTVPGRDDLAQATAGADDSPLSAQGVDTVLEVALSRVGTRGSGSNAPVQLYMEARVRLVSTADNRELFGAEYEYRGRRLKLAEWSAGRGGVLLQELQNGYDALGAHIHDSIFLLYPFPDRNPHAAGTLSAAFGLAPLAPRTRGQLSGDPLLGRYFEWTAVDGLHPELRWESFPRTSDLATAQELAGRIRHVRYDLVIAREHNQAPAGIVYRREGLPGASHTVREGLQPGSRYFWSVRARFELDGRERVTEWGTVNYRTRERLTAPSNDSYRFRTR
jgi:hypothetical protein